MSRRVWLTLSIVGALCIPVALTASSSAASVTSSPRGASGLPEFSGAPPEIIPIGVSAAAAPDATFMSCVDEPHNGLCLWHDSGYSGTMWFFDQRIYSHNRWHYVGDAANDKASSLYNKRVNGTLISKNMPPTSPDQVCVVEQGAYNNLANNSWPDGSSANDSISGFNLLDNLPNC